MAVRVPNLEDAICLRMIYLILYTFFSACKNTLQARKYHEFKWFLVALPLGIINLFISTSEVPLDLGIHEGNHQVRCVT